MPRVYKRTTRGSGAGRARARVNTKYKSRRSARATGWRRVNRSLPLAGRPKNKIIKLRYATIVGLNAATGAAAGHSFRANSIYDPDNTGIGHQPLGHDQWALFYNHYRVLGAKITINFASSGAGHSMVAGCFLDDDASGPTPFDNEGIIEKGGKYRVMDDAGGPGNRTIVCKYSAKKFHNASNVKDRDDLKAAFGSNPSEMAYFVLWAQALNTAVDPGVVYCNVKIDYIVSLEEAKDLAQS